MSDNEAYRALILKKRKTVMDSEQTSEKQIAISAVLKVIPLCQQVEIDGLGAVEKTDGSPVTVADFGAQAFFCEALGEAFPKDAIVAEEDSQKLRGNPELMQRVTGYVNSFTEGSLSTQTVCKLIDRGGGEAGKRFWALDPIDGTKEFLQGGPYAIALALIVEGEVKLGVLGCPNLRQKWDDPQAQRGCLFVAERGERGVGLYLPFRPENIPAPMSDNDFPIRVGINLPPDDNGGALVEKQIVRGLYKYLAQLNAYLAACMIFNKHGRSPHGNLINPTEPDPNTPRLESGQYVNPATDKPLFTRRGKPITDLFHPEAVDVLARVYRKEAENYPTLDEKEIMRAVYPNETWKKDGQPGRWADKAWEAWEAIAEKGYIRIESKGKGLQILPSDRHVRLHHEILKASRESQRGK